MEQLVLPAGTIITCPGCDAEMAELVVDLFPTDKLSIGAVRGLGWIPGFDVKTICPFCGDYFTHSNVDQKQYSIHTKGGWF